MTTLLSLLKHLFTPSIKSPPGPHGNAGAFPYHRHGDPPGDHVHPDDTKPQSRVIWSYNGGAEDADTTVGADPDTCDGYEVC